MSESVIKNRTNKKDTRLRTDSKNTEPGQHNRTLSATYMMGLRWQVQYQQQQQHCQAQYESKQANGLKQQVATGVGTQEGRGGKEWKGGGSGSKQASPLP